ncbi:MAG: tetratricopeptide repeat protein, partial [Planctomycetes bacterium]|nr:tetratricopeptide repeat protein [Planctomycetota bacterium]
EEITRLLDAQRPLEGQRLAAELTSLYPRSARAWFFRGIVAMSKEAPAEALGYFERASELDPGRASILLNRGVCLSALGRHAEALPLLDRSIAARDEAKTRVQRALSLHALGETPRAMLDVRRALDQAPEPGELFNMVVMSRAAGDPEVLARARELLAAAPLSHPAELERRATFLEETHPRAALRDLLRVIELDPRRDALRVRAGRLLVDTGRVAEVLGLLAPVGPESAAYLPALELRTLVHYYSGEPERTLECWDELSRATPPSPLGQLYAAVALVRLGRLDEAEALIAGRSGEEDPNVVGLHAVIANARGEHEACLRGANVAFERGLKQPWLSAAFADSLDALGRPEALAAWKHLLTAPCLEPAARERAQARIQALEADER